MRVFENFYEDKIRGCMNKNKQSMRYQIILIAFCSMIGFAKSTAVQTDKSSSEPNVATPEQKLHTRDLKKDEDYLWLDIVNSQDDRKPHVKFYKNSEFSGNPSAELNDEGLFVHGRLVCKWRGDWKTNKLMRILYPVANPLKPCTNQGPVFSLMTYDQTFEAATLKIYLNESTNKYYEISHKGEMYYLKPEDAKQFKFYESELNKNKKNYEAFRRLYETDKSLRDFFIEKTSCVSKKSIDCLLDSKNLDKIELWLESICNAFNNPPPACKLDEDNQYPKAHFEKEIQNSFWAQIETINFKDPLKNKSVSFSFNPNKSFNLNSFTIYSKPKELFDNILFFNLLKDSKNKWKIETIELAYDGPS
jgi:hypothetical protein